MTDDMTKAVTTPDLKKAIFAAMDRVNAVPASPTMVDRISDGDWSDDTVWEGDIACGSADTDPDELDAADGKATDAA